MGTEIERKFLVSGDAWRAGRRGVAFRQGYLCTDPDRIVRVRTMGDRAALTVKSRPVGCVRAEFEYEIPLVDAEELLALCHEPLIEKTRYTFAEGGLVWEIDEFHGVNEGLVVAECELDFPDQVVAPPPWAEREVTGDLRYANSALVERPYTSW